MTYNLGHVMGADGKGIVSIEKTGTSGLVDTYTITYTDETTSTFEVTNGEGGADIVTAWEQTLSDTKVPSEKLTKTTLDTKQATLVSGTNIKTINNNSILGSGNIDIQGGGGSVDIDTSFPSTLSDTHVPSTKLTKNTLDTKVTGSKVNSWSSTTSDSNVPSEKLVKDSLDVKVNTSDIANNLTTTTAGKVLDARQGKALADLIGDAIDYINL